MVNVLGTQYKRSRVVYSLCKGRIPDNMYIDHADGNRLNDNPENLRLVTPQQNAWNADGKGGRLQNYLPKGICFDVGRYKARIRINGKSYNKRSTSIKTLLEWLQVKRKDLQGDYAFDGWADWTEDDQRRADERYGVIQPQVPPAARQKREVTRGIQKGHKRKARTDDNKLKVPTYDAEGRLLYQCQKSGRYYAMDPVRHGKRLYWRP